MTIHKIFVCAALALAPACSKSSPAEQMVSLVEEIGAAVDSANGDCGKMADAVQTVINKYDLNALKEAAEKVKADKDKSKELMSKYGDRMKNAMPKMMGMLKCAEDPKMKDVQAKLKGVM